jgi:hypothetical protein
VKPGASWINNIGKHQAFHRFFQVHEMISIPREVLGLNKKKKTKEEVIGV